MPRRGVEEAGIRGRVPRQGAEGRRAEAGPRARRDRCAGCRCVSRGLRRRVRGGVGRRRGGECGGDRGQGRGGGRGRGTRRGAR
ncbi:hypothetical protein CP971_13800 [Streptomyces viridifaciens]|nr:hypothetical protein CP971_13800 [Streptomyces viridifaciens]